MDTALLVTAIIAAGIGAEWWVFRRAIRQHSRYLTHLGKPKARARHAFAPGRRRSKVSRYNTIREYIERGM